ncbi:Coproporphyrinogen III oxidase and Fe-S oxidoreductase [Yersinia bercovieri ATCC 43970]|uniref:Coproporphyrinogen III oxidase n=2 Tax=Yersinia bercovieri TaxID=634 RepID=A0A2G4U016_YERBE|nr:Coproporphyrinogen III oxidase and Fe-S oxidoreductase [Yersinia bercovieri ATCC 43970]PHZ26651.1 hypothetical protein CS533_15305 [Yersinia bercovieri]QDW34999.1 hypothetical protein FFE93_019355 [Yersinia sp. KBS0713]CNI99826.1 coproporphyrinogen III oxidase [Yersinia bercovieri]
MPWRDSQQLPAESLQDSWQSLLQKRLPRNKRLLYLHIPFCATHCTFCGFYQNPLQPESTARYTDYLLRELSMEANSPLLQSEAHGLVIRADVALHLSQMAEDTATYHQIYALVEPGLVRKLKIN